MNLCDVILNINNVKKNENLIKQIEAIYKCQLNDFASRVISIIDNGLPLDEENCLYKVSDGMIIAASEEMQIDFANIHLIPIFDYNDNDYICYDFANDQWCIFNIVDEIRCKENKELLDLVKDILG